MSLRWIFFRIPKPRQYNYKPLYYDPVKEEQSKRWQKHVASDKSYISAKHHDVGDTDDDWQVRRERISRAFRRRRFYSFSAAGDRSYQMLRTIVIALILALISYYLMK